MSTFRGAELYVNARTKRRLHWISKAIADGRTADEIGDSMLNETIEARYPQVKQLEAEYDRAEERLRQALNGTAQADG